jgi:hypothetical protein
MPFWLKAEPSMPLVTLNDLFSDARRGRYYLFT